MQLGSSGCKTLSYFSPPHSFFSTTLFFSLVRCTSAPESLLIFLYFTWNILPQGIQLAYLSAPLAISHLTHAIFFRNFLWPPYPKINTLIHVLSISFSVCLLDQLFGHLCIHLCAHLLSLTNDTIELIRGILHIKRTKLHHCE